MQYLKLFILQNKYRNPETQYYYDLQYMHDQTKIPTSSQYNRATKVLFGKCQESDNNTIKSIGVASIRDIRCQGSSPERTPTRHTHIHAKKNMQ